MAKVDRAALGGQGSQLLPDEVSEVILRGAAEQSLIAQHARTRPMNAQKVKITEAEVSASNVFWVGEGARKSTDAPSLSSKTWSMEAAELAVIVPLDENVRDDASLDLFELFAPSIETAIANKLDNAAIFGNTAPSAWAYSIVDASATVGHAINPGLGATDAAILDSLAGSGADPADGLLDSIEEDGFVPDQALVQVRFRSKLRSMKDADNRYIFGGPNGTSVPTDLFGVDLDYIKKDVWPTSEGVNIIMGDFSHALLGTRQGVRYKTFDQGVITDGAGNVVYSLMENDMVALRVTARYGFTILADDTHDLGVLALGNPFPFATLLVGA